MKVIIDPQVCSGHGRCYSLSPSVFDADDDGHGIVVAESLDAAQLEAARVGAANCPERAITIVD